MSPIVSMSSLSHLSNLESLGVLKESKLVNTVTRPPYCKCTCEAEWSSISQNFSFSNRFCRFPYFLSFFVSNYSNVNHDCSVCVSWPGSGSWSTKLFLDFEVLGTLKWPFESERIQLEDDRWIVIIVAQLTALNNHHFIASVVKKSELYRYHTTCQDQPTG